MGEYGFITGDGVYHVTAYATDENGNFKILFMKNLKIGLPGNQTKNVLQLPTKPPLPQPTPPPRQTPTPPPQRMPKALEFRPINPSDTRTCSGCAIPKEEPRDQSLLIRPPSKKLDVTKMTTYMKHNMKELVVPETPTNVINGDLQQKSNKVGKGLDNPTKKVARVNDRNREIAQDLSKRRLQPSAPSIDPRFQTEEKPRQSADTPEIGADPRAKPDLRINPKVSVDRAVQSGRKLDDQSQPKAPSGQRDRSGKSLNPPIDRNTLEEMRKAFVGLLYKFNYTVGYHGHHEKGDFVGSKDGGYYFVGRDGLRRDVEYVANDFGYQPYLTQEQVSDKDTPKEGSEKEAGLKGYEFRWFSERE
ncbi:uncharacterized protein LOC119648340 isoform X2 [Hermetia illucens]|nr:uncharacterized protein LOC119648340 isoform X2 [Hermetia illucens]